MRNSESEPCQVSCDFLRAAERGCQIALVSSASSVRHLGPPHGNHQIHQVLEEAKKGDQSAKERLIPLAYAELRGIAGAMMAKERAGHTLQPTALIHEAYLRLGGTEDGQPAWDSRVHFFTAAAEAMRRILVDHARRKLAIKRGGDWQKTTWSDSMEFEIKVPADELVAVDEALAKFEKSNADAAKVVKLRYFAGMTVEETASTLGVSVSSVNRTWRTARAWLLREVSESRSS